VQKVKGKAGPKGKKKEGQKRSKRQGEIKGGNEWEKIWNRWRGKWKESRREVQLTDLVKLALYSSGSHL
jgi:hypothetical protein